MSGGVGEFLMRKMGWKTGEGLGRNREGTVEPIVIDFKVDRKGARANSGVPQEVYPFCSPFISSFKTHLEKMAFLYVAGLVAEGEKPQKQTGGLVVTKDLMGKK